MPRVLRCLICVLIALAVVFGGGADRAALAAATPMAVMASNTPCDMTAPAAYAALATPCKSTAMPCCKQIATAEIGLPARITDGAHLLRSKTIAWWAACLAMPGLAREPEILPPRTA